MKTPLVLFAALAVCVQTFGQPILRQATDAELTAGADVHAYVNPRQAAGIGGATNGQTSLQVSNIVNANAILQQSGTGTNTTVGTLTVLNGAYKTFYFASGAYLRTNTIAPFDWEFRQTNGNYATGTNNVTKITFTKAGAIVLNSLTAASSVQAGSGVVTADTNGLTVSTYAPASGKTNVIFVLSDGSFTTNDYATWVASLGGGGSQTPWASDIDGGGFSLANVGTLRTTTANVTTLNATNMAGNGWGLTNLNIFDTPTNAWSGTAFWLGTNSVIKTSSAVGIVSIINTPATGTERFGQLVIVAGADITVTNLIPGVHASDNAFSRVCTNGNTMTIAIDMILGVCTNMFIVQCH